MNFKQFLIENVARTNALKKQQELVDEGEKKIEVTKLLDGVYQLTATTRMKKSWFCTPDGRVEELGVLDLDTTKLLTSAHHAYLYTKHVLKGPFPAGEVTLATSAWYAYLYARDILKGPFPAGEKTLATDAHDAYFYAKHVLNAPFPAGEVTLATSAPYAYYYARDVLKGPFPAGEPEIMKSSEHKAEYKEFLASLKP